MKFIVKVKRTYEYFAEVAVVADDDIKAADIAIDLAHAGKVDWEIHDVIVTLEKITTK